MNTKSFRSTILGVVVLTILLLLNLNPNSINNKIDYLHCNCFKDSIISFHKIKSWYYIDHTNHSVREFKNIGHYTFDNRTYLSISENVTYYFRQDDRQGFIWTSGFEDEVIFYSLDNRNEEFKVKLDASFKTNKVNFEFDSLCIEIFPMLDSLVLNDRLFLNVIKYKAKYYYRGKCIVSKPTYICSKIGILVLLMNNQKILSLITDSVLTKE